MCNVAEHRCDAVLYQWEVEYNATGGAATMRNLKLYEKGQIILNK